MKKIITLSMFFCIALGFAQNAPINFEPGGIGANWTWTVFEDATQPPLEFVANPGSSAVNSSATVAKFTALISGAPYAGCESMHGADIGAFTLNANNCTVRIMVWKSSISPVGIKFANQSGGSTGEIKVSNTLINQWEQLTFNFSSKIGEPTSTDINQIIIFPDFTTRTQDNIVYFDNITFGNLVVPPPSPSLPLDFESSTLTYTFTNFGNAATVKAANPMPSGINTSNNVAILTKPPGDTWAGSFIELNAPIDFTNSQTFKMKTYSPFAGITVKLKLENLGNAAINTEIDAVTTAANAWEELTFPFPNIVGTNNYQRVVVFFNFGSVGNNEQYYFDDIRLAPSLSNSVFNQQSNRIFPNPVSDVLFIESKEPILGFNIYNTLGQEVLSKSIETTSFSIDLTTLHTGVYLLKTNTNGVVKYDRIIKK